MDKNLGSFFESQNLTHCLQWRKNFNLLFQRTSGNFHISPKKDQEISQQKVSSSSSSCQDKILKYFILTIGILNS
jgi:hypothetical protein